MALQSSLVRRGALVVALTAGVITLGSTTPSSASGDRSVDPSTLTPAPPDFFNSTCAASGTQIICDLAFVDPGAAVEEPLGIVCGTGPDQFEVLDTWTRTVKGKRFYSTDGLLLRRHFDDRWDGTLTNSVTGATVSYTQRGTILHDLTVPGDNSTGLSRETVRLRVFGDTGTVLVDAGRVVRDRADDDSVVFIAGKHSFEDYWNGDADALDPLCDALSS
jgi:hypothetical protein